MQLETPENPSPWSCEYKWNERTMACLQHRNAKISGGRKEKEQYTEVGSWLKEPRGWKKLTAKAKVNKRNKLAIKDTGISVASTKEH